MRTCRGYRWCHVPLTPVVGQVMEQAQWRARESAHHDRVDAATAAHLQRRHEGRKHPVNDFLWTYYSHRPAQLRRWHPGAGVGLLGDAALERLGWRFYTEVDAGPAGSGVAV